MSELLGLAHGFVTIEHFGEWEVSVQTGGVLQSKIKNPQSCSFLAEKKKRLGYILVNVYWNMKTHLTYSTHNSKSLESQKIYNSNYAMFGSEFIFVIELILFMK